MKVSQEFQLTEEIIRLAIENALYVQRAFEDLVVGNSSMYAVQRAVMDSITIDMALFPNEIMMQDADIIP